MLAVVLPITLGITGLAMALNLYRLLIGPAMPDRVLALDTLYINSLGLIVVLSMLWRSTLYFEAALLIAVIGFLSTVAVAKYLCRGDIIE